MRVVMAPDSFKGSVTAAAAAAALAEGWRSVRPADGVLTLPQADGGEGTLDAVAAARPEAVRHWVERVTGPDGRPVRGCWLELGDGTAVAELAQPSGLPLMAAPDPLGATSRGLGEVLADLLERGVTKLVVGIGGSASTDGGTGMLTALGWAFLDDRGRPLPPGGGALTGLAEVRRGPTPDVAVTVLSDVDAPLLGPRGAAAVFGPQKGADPDQVALLDRGLHRLADLVGGEPDAAGAGAAGGVGYGLVVGLGAGLTSGAAHVARLSGLVDLLPDADVLITGEGRFDPTSGTGKVVGHALALAAEHGCRTLVVAGQVDPALAGPDRYSLTDLAGTTDGALAEPEHWLRSAGALAASGITVRPVP